MTITQAAFTLGRDRVLTDPTDADVVLAAVELARGSWPKGFTVDREFERSLVAAYEQGERSVASR
jgi:hypothetical protein